MKPEKSAGTEMFYTIRQLIRDSAAAAGGATFETILSEFCSSGVTFLPQHKSNKFPIKLRL